MSNSKIILVYPTIHRSGMNRIKPFWLPPLGLATVAGTLPEDWEIHLVDENVEDVDFEENCDLVMIGCMTANSGRAYEIAKEFRGRGKTVIMGGPHATVRPDEVGLHANTVIVGDAEMITPTVIEDFKNNCLQKIYFNTPNQSNINSFAHPRRDLYKKGAYLSQNTIQATRGCPYVCSFCSIASRYQRQYGKKNIDQLLQEVAEVDKRAPIFFVDDNIFADKAYSKTLLQELKQFKISWWSQADITIARDRSLLELAKESGCLNLVVGFESLSEGGISTVDKHQNRVETYGDFIETLHRHGILVNPSFAFGTDCDREDVFEKTLNFLIEYNVIFATFNILTPLPGTKLLSQFESEGRILDRDNKHYNMGHPVFQPKNISPDALKQGYDWICNEFYSLPLIHSRISKIKSQKDLFNINLLLSWNLGYKKMIDTFGVFM